MMAGFSILDMLAGNTQPGGFMGQTLGNTTPSGLAGLMQQSQSPAAMALAPQQEMPAKKPGFFGRGGKGWGVLGIIGDAISAGYGGQPMFTQMVQKQREQEAEQQQALQRYQQEREDQRRQRKFMNLNDGGIAAVSDEGGLEIIREPQPDAPKATALEQQVEYLRRLNPKLTDEQAFEIAQRGVGGFQYSPTAIAAQTQRAAGIADAQGAARARYRAPEGGGGGGGGGRSLTPNARAKIISEGRAAIAKGADPAKVQARMRELGVQ